MYQLVSTFPVSNLSKLKNNVPKLDTGKVETTPVDLSKLSNVQNDAAKKTEYNAKIKDIEHKMSDTIMLVANPTLNAKINELKMKYLVLLT